MPKKKKADEAVVHQPGQPTETVTFRTYDGPQVREMIVPAATAFDAVKAHIAAFLPAVHEPTPPPVLLPAEISHRLTAIPEPSSNGHSAEAN